MGVTRERHGRWRGRRSRGRTSESEKFGGSNFGDFVLAPASLCAHASSSELASSSTVQPVCSWASPTLPGLPQHRCTAGLSIPSTSSAHIADASPPLPVPTSISHIRLRPTLAPPTASSARIPIHIGLPQNQVHCPSPQNSQASLCAWTIDPISSFTYIRPFALCLRIPSATSKFRSTAVITSSRIVSSMYQVCRRMVQGVAGHGERAIAEMMLTRRAVSVRLPAPVRF